MTKLPGTQRKKSFWGHRSLSRGLAYKIGKLSSKWNVNLLIARGLFTWLREFIRKLTYPKSKDKDKARREQILNFLLLGYISLSLIVLLLLLASTIITYERKVEVPVAVIMGVVAFFIVLYFMSRSGKSQAASYLLISTSILPALYSSFNWGVLVPQSLLMFT